MPGAKFLEGDEVNMRTVEEEDIEFIRDTYNLPQVRTYLTPDKPANLKQERDFFENVISQDDEINLAICQDEEMKGLFTMTPTRDEGVVRLSLWVHPDYQGNGYGTEASELAIDYAFNELRYHKALARTTESNRGSQRVWEELGFEKEGELREQNYRDGDFEDVFVYGLLEDEWE